MRFARKPKHDRTQPEQNLRKWGRYTMDNVEIAVPAAQGSQMAVVIDESIGGIGLLMSANPDVTTGQVMQLEYHGEAMQGFVASIGRQLDLYRLGVSWIDENDGQIRFKHAASYFKFNGLYVVCQCTEEPAGPTSAVVLWDAASFEMPSDRIIYRTVCHRRSDLEQMSNKLPMLIGLYGLAHAETPRATIEKVLDLEFSDLRQREPPADRVD